MSKRMPGSKGEHLDPGGLFRVEANRGGGRPALGVGPEHAGERITHPRLCRGAGLAARVRNAEQRSYFPTTDYFFCSSRM